MRPASLARLIAGTNGTANRQAETEPKQPPELGTADNADSDTKAATAAFNEYAAVGQHDGRHGATDDV